MRLFFAAFCQNEIKCVNMKIVQFLWSQVLVLKFVFNFFFQLIVCFAGVPMTFCVFVCELLGEMPGAGVWDSTSFYKVFLMSLKLEEHT